ncbi:MAG: hypothetical protein FWK04_12590 [Nostoc sp. GBBB01]|nr:hypothetical protein [Nostoc sp. GBBB01]
MSERQRSARGNANGQPTNINTQLKHVQEKQHHSAKQTPQETRTQATPLWLVFISDGRTSA